MDDAAIDAKGVRSVQVALDAAGAAAAADARANAAKLVVRRSQAERNAAFCEEVVAIGIAEAARQFLYLKSGNTLETHESGTAYVTYVNGKLTGEKKLAYSTYKTKSLNFFALAHAYSATTRGGVTIDRVTLDSRTWTDGNGNGKSTYAELSTLEFVLADGFGKELLDKIQPGGKSVTALLAEAANKLKAATRRPKKAAPAPAETTEAAETTPPKAKAPARRARRRGRRREDDDDDDFAPPPKAKAEDYDEIETAVGEAALAPAGTKTAELVDLMADNKMLQRDLATRDKEIADLKAAKQSEIAARDEELATTKAELAACKEQIKEKEDEIFNLALVVEPLKTQLAEVKNELAEVQNELAKEKDKNKTGRRQTAVSPLCDATNVRLTSSAA